MREDWLHGWTRVGWGVRMGTYVRCAGCGRPVSLAVFAPPPPDGVGEPDWPFDEASCPVHQQPEELATQQTAVRFDPARLR